MSESASEAIKLLRQLIATPSFSREEGATADLIARFLEEKGISVQRKDHNVWARSLFFDPNKPTLLLNSHHDTVKPNISYTRDPFSPDIESDTLFGLGSNDAGGPLVSLIAAFTHFYPENLPCNLILAATAEEEISGAGGIASILPDLGPLAAGIVGEPTGMQMAIAEKGLMVLDCTAHGKAGHAAREEGVNAIYLAMEAMAWFRSYSFEKVSEFLGPVKMSVTQVQAGTQHNVVPDRCTFVVDVRTNELYSNEEIYELISQQVSCEVKARSFRLQSSRMDPAHALVQAGLALGRTTYGSPTLSDQALMPFPTLKMGPGDSARSHSADEYILLSEIEEAIPLYIALIAHAAGNLHNHTGNLHA